MLSIVALPLIASIGAGLSPAGSSSGARHDRAPELFRTYRAEVKETFGTSVRRMRIEVSNGRYRAEEIHGSRGYAAGNVELYDGAYPPVAWDYNRQMRSARPTIQSCIYAAALMASQVGEGTVRRRYSIPTGMLLLRTAPRPSLGLQTWSQASLLKGSVVGRQRVAGFPCNVHQVVTRSANGTLRETRAWVEPKSGLVLRQQDTVAMARGISQPRLVRCYEVTRLEIVQEIPTARFQLPAGVTAHVPETMKPVRLPPQVVRADEPGMGIRFPPPASARMQSTAAHRR